MSRRLAAHPAKPVAVGVGVHPPAAMGTLTKRESRKGRRRRRRFSTKMTRKRMYPEHPPQVSQPECI